MLKSLDLFTAMHVALRESEDHQSQYDPSSGDIEYLYQISRKSFQ